MGIGGVLSGDSRKDERAVKDSQKIDIANSEKVNSSVRVKFHHVLNFAEITRDFFLTRNCMKAIREVLPSRKKEKNTADNGCRLYRSIYIVFVHGICDCSGAKGYCNETDHNL